MATFSITKAVSALFPRWGGTGLGSRLLYLLPGARLDYLTEAGDLWANSVVALALQWKADRYTQPPIRVSRIGRKGQYEPLPRHPLVDLWNRPSQHFTRSSVEAAVGMSLDVDGNGYVQKVRSKAGQVVELWWQPHFACEPQWPSDGSAFVGNYQVSIDGGQYDVDPADMLHFRSKLTDPHNVRLGLAPLKACLREVCTINEESGFTASLLRNSAVPGLAIVPDSDMLRPSKDDAERIKERVADSFTGDNRGGTLVLAGKYKVQPIGWSPEQLALDKLPQAAIARIASALGVAPMVLGLPDPQKTYSNLAEAARNSWGGVRAVQSIVAETLRWSLLPDFNTDPFGHVVEYDYSEISELQESLDLLHTRVREDYAKGVIQLNEARDLIGLEPVPDGDRFVTDGAQADPFAEPMAKPAPVQEQAA